MVTIIKDKDLFEHITEYDVILIGTSIYNYLSQGFQRDIMLHYPIVQEKNFRTPYADNRKLGTILPCETENLEFVLCYITRSINFRPRKEKDFLNYDALEKCLTLVNTLYKGKKVATTVMGNTRFDGNGDKEKILEIFKKCCTNIDITLYDYRQLSYQEKKKMIYLSEQELKKTDYNAYRKVVSERKEREKKLKELNGHTTK